MPDITMCGTDSNCPKKQECYRYMAIPSEHWQSYCDFTEICHEKTDYKMFLEITKGDKIKSEMLGGE